MKRIITIAMYDLEGHLLKVFEVETIFELEVQLNIPRGGISACLSRKSLSTKNFQFIEIINTNKVFTKIGDISSNVVGQSYKPVHKFYDGKYICTYDNILIASELNKLDSSGISKCCLGKYNSCGGFTWKYA